MDSASDPLDGWEHELRDLPDAMHTTPAMAIVFGGRHRVRRMLDVEVALARAEAHVGVISSAVAERIEVAARDMAIDVPALAEAGALAGTIALPVVTTLRDRLDDEARSAVHLGATSQDIIDTAMVLQVREALEIITDDLLAAGDAAAGLCRRHRDTPMVGRTLLQQAVPVTFGLKGAGWLSGITRALQSLDRLRTQSLALQFGGAAGTLASLGAHGLAVSERLGQELGLPVPALPWHGERSRVAELAAGLATTSGTMAKIALDIVLLMQTEVAEVTEASAEGKGRSSAMPQKRNPVDTMAVLAGDRLAQAHACSVLGSMAQEHERAVGGWQAEWTAIPACCRIVASSVARMRSTLESLTLDTTRMRANLDAGGGQPLAESLATALSSHLGKPEAYRVVSALCTQAVAQGVHLREIASADPQVGALLDREVIEAALEPANYLGSSGLFVDRALETFRADRGRRPATTTM